MGRTMLPMMFIDWMTDTKIRNIGPKREVEALLGIRRSILMMIADPCGVPSCLDCLISNQAKPCDLTNCGL